MSGKINLKRWLAAFTLLLATWCTAASGRTIYVDDDGPADFNTIQEAIDDSNDGDTIIVQPGLYLEFVRFRGKNITLKSTNPADSNVVASTIIDYGVGFDGSEDPNCQLTDFKINGWIYGGINHTRATISHCLLISNIVYKGTVIKNCDGTIKNCVVSDNLPISDHIDSAISDCHGLIKNCTVANNFSGIRVLGGGTTTIENCIIYGNSVWLEGGATVNILYSNVEGGIYSGGDRTVNWGPGNMDADPCFADAANRDYHLKSQAGRWDVNDGRWTRNDVTSPCIDAGNPNSPVGYEPFPNGGRINMGAYGGTKEASKSYFGRPPCEIIIAGDINGDCIVNFLDFQLIALHWLRDESQ
ncbi:MAG: hypothetical protein FVQ85_07245 [Planctomycetes bacterium]|nr:hypothetical protein [Planctomycetota bacterium]